MGEILSTDLVSISKTLITAGVELSGVGLKLPPKLPRPMWSDVGERVGQLSSASQWAIGDWWNYGKHTYGDRAELINGSGWNGPSYETCEEYAKICRRYPESSMRIAELSFSHHKVVAWLAIDARQPLLQKALKEKLTVAELKAIARQVGGRGARDTGESETRESAPAGFDAADTPPESFDDVDTGFDAAPDGAQAVDAPEPRDKAEPIDFSTELLSVVTQLEELNRMCAATQMQRAWEASTAMQRRLARLDRLKDFMGCQR